MTETSAAEVFVRDMTEVLTFPGQTKSATMLETAWSEAKFATSPRNRSIADILDSRLAPLRILYTPEYPNTKACSSMPAEQPPNVEPVPISRESAAPVKSESQESNAPSSDSGEIAAARPALPWVADGKLIGQRHYGDYCINPLKKSEVVIISPDGPEIVPASGSCAIL